MTLPREEGFRLSGRKHYDFVGENPAAQFFPRACLVAHIACRSFPCPSMVDKGKARFTAYLVCFTFQFLEILSVIRYRYDDLCREEHFRTGSLHEVGTNTAYFGRLSQVDGNIQAVA